MVTTLARIIKYGFQHFWRNGWLSVTTIAVMIITLVVFHHLIIFRFLTKTAVAVIQNKIDISVYFKNSTPEDQILKAAQALESLAEVKSVEYASPDKALEEFKSKHQGDQVIAAALQELDGNPLLAALHIKAKTPNDYEKIASYLNSASFAAALEKVTYGQNQAVINRLAKISDTLENVGLALVVVLALVAALVTFNTVRLAIYSNREELNIMRLVGAPNRFLRGPYVVSGVIYGIISAFLSMLISWPLISAAAPYVNVLIPEANLISYFYNHFPNLLVYQLLFGIALGISSAILAVRRYLKI